MSAPISSVVLRLRLGNGTACQTGDLCGKVLNGKLEYQHAGLFKYVSLYNAGEKWHISRVMVRLGGWTICQKVLRQLYISHSII